MEYLTASTYNRWYRQYQVNMGYYLDVLNHLRIRAAALPSENIEIHALIDEIDRQVDLATPRDFFDERTALVGFEKFAENLKVLVNIILHIAQNPDRFSGIYQEEKNRVLIIHHTFKFKDKLTQLREMIETAEAKAEEETLKAPASVTVG